MDNYNRKKSNYKSMLGGWKIAILLEAGYQKVKTIDNKGAYVKISDRIFFKNLLNPYPRSQSMTNEEINFFCEGLKFASNYIVKQSQNDSYYIIALYEIHFSDCDIQEEAFTACAIQWASEAFLFPMPNLNIYFNSQLGNHGKYVFDFSNI